MIRGHEARPVPAAGHQSGRLRHRRGRQHPLVRHAQLGHIVPVVRRHRVGHDAHLRRCAGHLRPGWFGAQHAGRRQWQPDRRGCGAGQGSVVSVATRTAQLGTYGGGSGPAPTANTAFVQGQSGAGTIALQLQPSGGAVYTHNSTLDDGSGNATFSGGTLQLSNGTSNTLLFSATGVAPPSNGTRSVGTKVVLYPVGATACDFAIGIDGSTLWQSVALGSGQSFKWYGGTGTVMVLGSAGSLATTTANGTARNTLDDGAGNAIIAGQLTTQAGLLVNGSSGATVGSTLYVGNLATLNQGLVVNGNAGLSVGGNCQLGQTGSTHTVSTPHSTLDDGAGNLRAAGYVAANTTASGPAFGFANVAPGGYNPAGALGIYLDSGFGIALNPGRMGYTPRTGVRPTASWTTGPAACRCPARWAWVER